MWKNHFIIALRNLLRNKIFSAINILGLAIGIATCLVILLFIKSELDFDRFNEKADRIVRVVFQGSVQGVEMNESHVMPPVAEAILGDYPEVEQATRLRLMGNPKITYGDKSLRSHDAAFVDPNFFQVFTLPLIQGDAVTALKDPNTVVISKTMANAYFGEEDPFGKELWMNEGKDRFTITGVMEDIPANSHFHFDLLVSMLSFPEARNPSWMVSEFYTYLVLQQGYDYRRLEEKLTGLVEKYMGPQLQEAMGITLDQFQQAGNSIGLFLQPLKSIHLYSNMSWELGPRGDIRYVYIFGAIAIFMLLIACINFMNLSTASASNRAKEVGVRKVLGSAYRQLVVQFLVESSILSLIASLIAILLVKFSIPVFNEFSGKNLTVDYLSQPWILPSLLLFGLVVGIIAGTYPAFVLTSFKPVSVLKGSFFTTSGSPGRNKISLRSALVVFQFSISVILIIGTLVVYSQLEYIQNKELGYEKDQVLVLPGVWQLGDKAEALRQQLLADSRIKYVSTSGYLPSGPSYNNNFFVFPDDDVTAQIKTLRYEVDDQYIPALGLELLSGRNFSEALGNDNESIIINESAVAALGWENEVLGRTLTRANQKGERVSYRVIGVVKDFHFKSMYEHIYPLVMTKGNLNGSVIVKFQTGDVSGLVSSIKRQWTALSGDEPFDYSFLDERFYQTYSSERNIGYLLSVFALLTIFIACLGLFGLATFTIKQRTKEIGVRKVLGAEVSTIVTLISRDFLKLVCLAAAIAFPLAYWVMGQWLESFAYRVNMSIGIFLLAGGIVTLVAFLTISYEAIKTALVNPIKSLRSE